MADNSIFPILQYGTQAARIAFVPNPPAGIQVLYLWYETDNAPDTYAWDGGAWVLINAAAGGGTVTNTGTLTAGRLIVGNGSVDVTVGDLSGDVATAGGTATTLANTAVTPGSYTNTDLTVDSKGRITAAANGSSGGSGITELTGDVTAGPGSGSQAATLANTAVTPGSYTNADITVDAKGRVTAAANGSSGGGGNATYTSAYASPPGSPSAGDLWFPSDGFSAYRYSGSIWVPWGPNFPFSDPVANGPSTWVNQGGAALSTANGGLAVSIPATAGISERVIVKSIPTVPYVITACFQYQFNPRGAATAPHFGLVFRQSSDGKLASFVIYPAMSGTTGITASSKYTSATAFSAHYLTVNGAIPYFGQIWLRIADDNTNRTCNISMDGINFLSTPVHSIGRTDFLTADQVGIIGGSGDTTWDHKFTVLSWKET